MSEISKEKWKELRKAFPTGSVGKIPKGGRQLDYVGHAAVTDRLLEVDPTWTWEPMAVDAQGAPVSTNGNLWIRLTVLGVTRIGVGDGANAKECISDAIRNAAMRFGVALDLWSKEELESTIADPSMKNEKPSETRPTASTPREGAEPIEDKMSLPQLRKMQAMLTEFGIADSEARHRYVREIIGHDVVKTSDMTRAEAVKVIDSLDENLFALSQGSL